MFLTHEHAYDTLSNIALFFLTEMARIANNDEFGHLLECPILLTLMIDPVSDSFGHTYERSAIEHALQVRPGVSPMTSMPYGAIGSNLRPEYTLQNMCAVQVWSSHIYLTKLFFIKMNQTPQIFIVFVHCLYFITKIILSNGYYV
jgi:hypothetical protein